MHLSTHSDYACRVLIYLVSADSKSASIEEISQAYQISKNHLVKVVHKLGKLGFIETVRGRKGGIHLARDPQTIMIGDVIRQTESFELVECFNQATNHCIIVGACGLKPWLARAMEAFLQTLDQVSLVDLVKNKEKARLALSISK